MSYSKIVLCLTVFTIGCLIQSQSEAHTVFKKFMDEKFEGMKVTCNACHFDGKPKTERNPFGMLFYREFADLNLTDNFKAKRGAEKKEYENEVMLPAFQKAYEKVSKMTYEEIIKEGLLDGIDKPEEKTSFVPMLMAPNSPLLFAMLTSAGTNQSSKNSGSVSTNQPKLEDSWMRRNLFIYSDRIQQWYQR